MHIDSQGFLIAKEDRVIDKESSLERLSLKTPDFFTDEELYNTPPGDIMIFDVECYRNFFYVAFKHPRTGKCFDFELSPDRALNIEKLSWTMWRFCLVGFNSKNYDLPMITYALSGASNDQLKNASDYIIQGNHRSFEFEEEFKLKIPEWNDIDIIEVAPLEGSLKLYSGRLHCATMQDLPYDPDDLLTQNQAEILRIYCCNDLDNTELLFDHLGPEISLRIDMSKEYGIDLRSKSDAQIAEAVICNELKKTTGFYPKKPDVDLDFLQYQVPDFIRFMSPKLNRIVKDIADSCFFLDGRGSPTWPELLGEVVKTKQGKKRQLLVKIGKTTYKLGMGGLHSQEETVCYKADDNTMVVDNDVASYYPRIILNQGLFPEHLGSIFLDVYNGIVERRLAAKRNGQKTINATLKIVINGSFGKFGSRYSRLYAPQLMLQVTITGQLALLMLIEMLEDQGIEVVSGNTDGIVCRYGTDQHRRVREVIDEWEHITRFETEETRYNALYSRDVNNYMAFKDDGISVKKKGTYAQGGLSKNPEHLICTDAVIAYLQDGIPLDQTIKACGDVSRFISVRNVRGGAEKNGIYLGKVVRWYYKKGEAGSINYVMSGNKVPKSDGAWPMMDLPDTLPTDIDYEWYERTATDILYDIGELREPETGNLFEGLF